MTEIATSSIQNDPQTTSANPDVPGATPLSDPNTDTVNPAPANDNMMAVIGGAAGAVLVLLVSGFIVMRSRASITPGLTEDIEASSPVEERSSRRVGDDDFEAPGFR
jgi:hypothetical protein